MASVDVPLRFAADDALRVARLTYGLEARVEELPSFADRNFRLETPEGVYVLKIARRDERNGELDLQNQALLHLQTLGIHAPRLRPAIDGKLLSHVNDGNGTAVRARLVSWLDGQPYALVEQPSLNLLRSYGAFLAKLGGALASFSHPAARRTLDWDLRNALTARRHLALLPDGPRRGRVEEGLRRFETIVTPRFDALPQSVIHNDANDYNVLVESSPTDHVSAVIDFGDVVHTARVCDPAIALAYVMLGHSDPFPYAKALLEGYLQDLPLTPSELELLPTLITTRLAVCILFSTAAKRERPEDPYLDVTVPRAWKLLELLAPLSDKEVSERIQPR